MIERLCGWWPSSYDGCAEFVEGFGSLRDTGDAVVCDISGSATIYERALFIPLAPPGFHAMGCHHRSITGSQLETVCL